MAEKMKHIFNCELSQSRHHPLGHVYTFGKWITNLRRMSFLLRFLCLLMMHIRGCLCVSMCASGRKKISDKRHVKLKRNSPQHLFRIKFSILSSFPAPSASSARILPFLLPASHYAHQCCLLVCHLNASLLFRSIISSLISVKLIT